MQNLCAFHNLLYNPSKSTNVFTWQTFRPLRKKFQYECTKRVNSQLILDTGQRVRTSGPFSVNKNPFNIRLSMQIKIIICIINKKNVYIYIDIGTLLYIHKIFLLQISNTNIEKPTKKAITVKAENLSPLHCTTLVHSWSL